MKSLICPSCGCIAHIQDHMEQLKNQAICEMCGSIPYVYDGEIEPFAFPGAQSPSTPETDHSDTESQES